MDEELKQALAALEARIAERIHDSETRILSAFYGWARPVEMRIKQLPAIDERLGLLEERITAVERKILERGL
jgi:hypothetical protein